MNTSFSSASLHIGSLCSRQKALLQRVQVALGARLLSPSFRPVAGLACVESGMMVLFVKHVHLQKDGGATRCQLSSMYHEKELTSCNDRRDQRKEREEYRGQIHLLGDWRRRFKDSKL